MCAGAAWFQPICLFSHAKRWPSRLGDRLDGQHAGLRRGDLDRQRDTVELLADPGDRHNIRVGEREVQQRVCGAVCE